MARMAPRVSRRVARAHAETPPGWVSTMGTNQTATATATAKTAVTASRNRRTEPATARRASGANACRADCRKPVASPSEARAAAPCHEWGRARHARMMRSGATARSNEYVATMEPLNQANGEVATSSPAASPTHRPPRSRPATTTNPAARADATAETSTSESIVPAPTPWTSRPATT